MKYLLAKYIFDILHYKKSIYFFKNTFISKCVLWNILQWLFLKNLTFVHYCQYMCNQVGFLTIWRNCFVVFLILFCNVRLIMIIESAVGIYMLLIVESNFTENAQPWELNPLKHLIHSFFWPQNWVNLLNHMIRPNYSCKGNCWCQCNFKVKMNSKLNKICLCGIS